MSCLLTRTIFGCDNFVLGGVRRVFMTNRSLISNFYYEPTDDSRTLINAINPTNVPWLEFKVPFVNCSSIDNLNVGLNGHSFTHKFETVFRMLDYDKRIALKDLIESNDICLCFQDSNDLWWILGEDKALKVIEYTSTTGNQPNDNNQYDVILGNTTRYKMRGLTDDFVTNFLLPYGSGPCETNAEWLTWTLAQSGPTTIQCIYNYTLQ